MRRKAVAIVLADGLDATGGISRILRYLVRQLAQDAPDIPILVQRTRWAGSGPAKHATAPFALAQFALQLTRRRVKVAHINVAPKGSTYRKMLFARAARLAGAKVIVHLHGGHYPGFLQSVSPRLRRLILAFFQTADRVIVMGDHWRDFTVQTLGVRPDRLVMIDNGVPAAEAIATPASAVPTIVFVGVLSKAKGVHTLLKALAILLERDVPFAATLCGGGAIDEFRDLARQLGIADKITFRGWVDEPGVAAALAEADIFTLPSQAENQPISVLEAMARGLPVVATAVGSIPEQVEDGASGFLVPVDDADALAEGLTKLACDPDLRVRMGKAGYERWERRYSIAATSRKMADLYRELLRSP